MSHFTSLQSIETLSSPEEIKQEIHSSPSVTLFVQQSRAVIKAILDGKDPRHLVIIGPCSIHHRDSALEFARRLIILQREISDSFYIVMRVYSEKSRTTIGWKGFLNDPFLDGSEDIATGIRWTRELLVTLNEMGVPSATEFLDPLAARYYEDLVSWGCIGARTSESQTHRVLASGLPMPIAFKNNTLGCIQSAINGMLAASKPHKKLTITNDGRVGVEHTKGNPHVHIALRGGRLSPNFQKESVQEVMQFLQAKRLPNAILIDCSHDNAPNHEEEQKQVFFDVMEQISEGNRSIKGIILESHLDGGQQSVLAKPLLPSLSITDPCLDWDHTAELLREGALILKKARVNSGEKICTCVH